MGFMEGELSPILEVKNLHFAYPDAPEILAGISFLVKKGEKIVIAGPNGAGKTTLFLNLTGLLIGTGMITINGLRLEKKNFPQIRRIMGMVFQSPDDQLFSNRVFDDVAYGLIYQNIERSEVERRTRKALEEVDMLPFEQAVPHHLSMGQKKRVAIATVLAMQPEVILFDEPTMELDMRAKKKFLQIIEKLPQTILLATHDLKVATTICERLLILDEGQLIYDGLMKDALCDTKLLEKHGLGVDL